VVEAVAVEVEVEAATGAAWAAVALAAAEAVSMAAAWLAGSMMAVVFTEVDFVVVNSTAVDFMIATSGDVSDSAPASTRTTTMTTTLTTIRMVIIRMPPAIHMLTTAVAMWSSDACTLRMAAPATPSGVRLMDCRRSMLIAIWNGQLTD
jgi:hypothetical protein